MTEDEAVKRQRWLARAVSVLAVLAVDDQYEAWREVEGAGFEPLVLDAVGALQELCDEEREGPWSTSEGRDWIRGQLAEMSAIVGKVGITDEVRKVARGIVEVVFPDAERWLRENPDQAKYQRPQGPDRG